MPLAEALFRDVDNVDASPFLVGLSQMGFDYPGLGIVVQSLLRHVMSQLLCDGIVNKLLVTNSEEANQCACSFPTHARPADLTLPALAESSPSCTSSSSTVRAFSTSCAHAKLTAVVHPQANPSSRPCGGARPSPRLSTRSTPR